MWKRDSKVCRTNTESKTENKTTSQTFSDRKCELVRPRESGLDGVLIRRIAALASPPPAVEHAVPFADRPHPLLQPLAVGGADFVVERVGRPVPLGEMRKLFL